MEDAIFDDPDKAGIYSKWNKRRQEVLDRAKLYASSSVLRGSESTFKTELLQTQQNPTYFNKETNPYIRSWTQQMQQGVSDSVQDPRGVVQTTKIEFLEDILANEERYNQLKSRSSEIRSERLRVGNRSSDKGILYVRHFGAGLLEDGMLDPSKEFGDARIGPGGGNTAAVNQTLMQGKIRDASSPGSSLSEKIVAQRFKKGEGITSVGDLSTDFIGYANRPDRVGVFSGSHLAVGRNEIDIITQAGGQPGERALIGKNKPIASLLFSLAGRDEGALDQEMLDLKLREILPAWEEEQIKAFKEGGGEDRLLKNTRQLYGATTNQNLRLASRDTLEKVKPRQTKIRRRNKMATDLADSGEMSRAVSRGIRASRQLRISSVKSSIKAVHRMI